MAFMTITAKKPGTCKRCGQEIVPGQRIRWARYGGSYHMAAECPANADKANEASAPVWQEPAPVMSEAARARYNATQRRYAPLRNSFDQAPPGYVDTSPDASHTSERADLRYWERVDSARELGAGYEAYENMPD